MYTGRRRAARAAHASAAAGRTTPWAAEAGTAEAEESSDCSGLLYGPHGHGDAAAENRDRLSVIELRRIRSLSPKFCRSCLRARPDAAEERAASSAGETLEAELEGRCSRAKLGDGSSRGEDRPDGLRRRLRRLLESRSHRRHAFRSIIPRRSAGRTTDRGSAASRC